LAGNFSVAEHQLVQIIAQLAGRALRLILFPKLGLQLKKLTKQSIGWNY